MGEPTDEGDMRSTCELCGLKGHQAPDRNRLAVRSRMETAMLRDCIYKVGEQVNELEDRIKRLERNA